jgi:peroxiredoxin
VEAPQLQKVYQQYKNRGGVVLGLSIDPDTVASLKKFQGRNKTAYPIAIDKGGKVFNHFNMGIPSGVLIDRSGVIRLVHEGYEPASFAGVKRSFAALLSVSQKRAVATSTPARNRDRRASARRASARRASAEIIE